jgi:hypothetical protein
MHRVLSTLAVTLTLVVAPLAGEPVSRDDIEAFMKSAKVVRQQDLSKGVTRPLRLTLSDGTYQHDAVFQAVDERTHFFKPDRGQPEVNFVDSWRYNVGAYRLAALLGLQDMMPVTIEYRYRGKPGALSWWTHSLMDEGERLKKQVRPPDVLEWNRQMYKQRVFTELVHDVDRNLGNTLITPEWRLVMLDFTRGFRLWEKIRPAELTRCDRSLLAGLRALSAADFESATKEYLSAGERTAVMKRRDLIVAHFDKLIQEQGEEKVLY